jgi:hypothetical protein
MERIRRVQMGSLFRLTPPPPARFRGLRWTWGTGGPSSPPPTHCGMAKKTVLTPCVAGNYRCSPSSSNDKCPVTYGSSECNPPSTPCETACAWCQGSHDGGVWATIRAHENDSGLSGAWATATWLLDGDPALEKGYRFQSIPDPCGSAKQL